MRIPRRIAGATIGVALLIGLAGCGQAVAGQGGPTSDPCDSLAQAPLAPTDVAVPSTAVIMVDPGTNMWIANSHTLPQFLTVYSDGTVIRAQGVGAHSDPLPEMIIGRIDDCTLQRAVAELASLADRDMGDPRISDQGTTRVQLGREGSSERVTISAYALGIGDEYVEPAQAEARARLSAAIDGLAEGMARERAWTPDRLRLTWFDRSEPRPEETVVKWPLDDKIAAVFAGESGRRYPCTVVAARDAAVIQDALGDRPIVSTWKDGARTATIAVGVLVPGQPGCPER
jgi:hypothetical protein